MLEEWEIFVIFRRGEVFSSGIVAAEQSGHRETA
ncbi:MAG: hypothetical protein G01um101420_112 [Parcubacteria group bacterium Gr01-1014_20]|nr:MAG: hypothetical protein G01um101420_112 [Parcubacteria group bacterium Gr01-1014_20]